MSKRIPNHLSHFPVIKVESYDVMDGKYHKNTDTKGLSLGFSQWSKDDISAKIWRFTGKQWSPQSEEMPLHRVIDLAILICETYESMKNNTIKDFEQKNFQKSFAENVSIDIAKINAEDFIKFASIFKTDLRSIEDSGRLEALSKVLKKLV